MIKILNSWCKSLQFSKQTYSPFIMVTSALHATLTVTGYEYNYLFFCALRAHFHSSQRHY